MNLKQNTLYIVSYHLLTGRSTHLKKNMPGILAHLNNCQVISSRNVMHQSITPNLRFRIINKDPSTHRKSSVDEYDHDTVKQHERWNFTNKNMKTT